MRDIEQADDLIEFFNMKEPRNQNRWVLINKLKKKWALADSIFGIEKRIKLK